jgi:hypothetical protein
MLGSQIIASESEDQYSGTALEDQNSSPFTSADNLNKRIVIKPVTETRGNSSEDRK